MVEYLKKKMNTKDNVSRFYYVKVTRSGSTRISKEVYDKNVLKKHGGGVYVDMKNGGNCYTFIIKNGRLTQTDGLVEFNEDMTPDNKYMLCGPYRKPKSINTDFNYASIINLSDRNEVLFKTMEDALKFISSIPEKNTITGSINRVITSVKANVARAKATATSELAAALRAEIKAAQNTTLG